MSLSGLKDVDREILKHVDDAELLKLCSLDRKTWNDVCDDGFLRRRLNKYPGIEKYKEEKESWKSFFLRATYYISKMKEDYEFVYISGDFKKQYEIIRHYNLLNLSNKFDLLLLESAEKGEISIVKYSLERGADIHTTGKSALIHASRNGHLEIVEYLVTNMTISKIL